MNTPNGYIVYADRPDMDYVLLKCIDDDPDCPAFLRAHPDGRLTAHDSKRKDAPGTPWSPGSTAQPLDTKCHKCGTTDVPMNHAEDVAGKYLTACSACVILHGYTRPEWDEYTDLGTYDEAYDEATNPDAPLSDDEAKALDAAAAAIDYDLPPAPKPTTPDRLWEKDWDHLGYTIPAAIVGLVDSDLATYATPDMGSTSPGFQRIRADGTIRTLYVQSPDPKERQDEDDRRYVVQEQEDAPDYTFSSFDTNDLREAIMCLLGETILCED